MDLKNYNNKNVQNGRNSTAHDFNGLYTCPKGCNILIFPGLTEKEILRQEMVAQLCMGDKTHSQLLDLISFLL